MSEYKSVARVTALQEAIEAKTGATYGDLADGVQVLLDGYGQGGGSDVIPVIANCMEISSDYADTPEIIKLHFLTRCSLTYIVDFDTVGKNTKIVGTFGENGGLEIRSFNMSNYVGAIQEIDLGGAKINCNTIQMFRNCRYLERINAVITVHAVNNKWDRDFMYCGKLADIRYAENHISVSGIPMYDCSALSDDSLISIANALVATTAGDMTWSLHATPKARCEEILGTVTQKTADDGTTYDFFTADSAGTVTLTEFITTTKGWTLA